MCPSKPMDKIYFTIWTPGVSILKFSFILPLIFLGVDNPLTRVVFNPMTILLLWDFGLREFKSLGE
jgi:hypothetical protein